MGNDDRDCLWDFEESDLPLEAVEGEDVLADRLSLDAVPDVLEMPAEKRGLNNGLPNVPLSPRKKNIIQCIGNFKIKTPLFQNYTA